MLCSISFHSHSSVFCGSSHTSCAAAAAESGSVARSCLCVSDVVMYFPSAVLWFLYCMQVPCRDLKAGGRSKGGEWLEAPNVLQDEVRSSDFVIGWWLPEDEDRDCCTGSQTSNSYLFVYLFFIRGIRIMLSVKGGEMPCLILSFISKFSLNYLKCGVISGGRRWEAEF